MTRTMGKAGLLVVACVLLVACGSDAEPSPEPTATVASPTQPATPPPVTLGDIVWTTSVDGPTGAPIDAITSLPNDAPRVVAAVSADSIPAGTVLQARWTIDGEPLTALQPEPVTLDESREDVWVTWTLTWNAEGPWPVGLLGIQIDVNGEPRSADDLPIVRARSNGRGGEADPLAQEAVMVLLS